MSLTTTARALARVPLGLLQSAQTKLSVAVGGYAGLAAGAHARAAGREPAAIFASVRGQVFAADGTLAADANQPTPVRRALVEHVGPWVTEPVIEFAPSTQAAIERVAIVPVVKLFLALMEAAAGVGYWLAGIVPAPVIGYGGLVGLAAVLLWRLLSFRAVIDG